MDLTPLLFADRHGHVLERLASLDDNSPRVDGTSVPEGKTADGRFVQVRKKVDDSSVREHKRDNSEMIVVRVEDEKGMVHGCK